METLKLSDIQVPLSFKIHKGLQNWTIRELANTQYNTIDFDVYLPSKQKNLQRHFVWSLPQKQDLIISVLKGISLTSIAIIQHKTKEDMVILKVVDGKQRLSTLINFYLGKFPLSVNNKEYYFKDLEPKAQQIISLYTPVTDIAYEYHDKLIPDDQKIAWFEMINFAGTPQDEEHMKNLKQ